MITDLKLEVKLDPVQKVGIELRHSSWEEIWNIFDCLSVERRDHNGCVSREHLRNHRTEIIPTRGEHKGARESDDGLPSYEDRFRLGVPMCCVRGHHGTM